MKPARKRRLVEYIRGVYPTSKRRACELAQINRSTAYYRSCKRDRGELRVRRVSYGYRRLHVLLLRDGWRVNHKLVYRIYKE